MLKRGGQEARGAALAGAENSGRRIEGMRNGEFRMKQGPPVGADTERNCFHARALLLATADEGVRRCARGGRAPQLLKSSSVVGRARFAVRAAQRRNESASWPLSAIVSVTGRMVKQMATPVQALLKLCRHAYCKRYGNCFAPAIMAS